MGLERARGGERLEGPILAKLYTLISPPVVRIFKKIEIQNGFLIKLSCVQVTCISPSLNPDLLST
jgi:hypothetical protein